MIFMRTEKLHIKIKTIPKVIQPLNHINYTLPNRAMRFITLFSLVFSLISCSSKETTNIHDPSRSFYKIYSNYTITDRNNYGCEKINIYILEHVLRTGIEITPGDEHDHYSMTGCSIKGTLAMNKKVVKFTFDYGGILYIGKDLIIGCAEACCKNNFEYCTWEPEDLK